MFKNMQNLDGKDKHEAVDYLQKYLDKTEDRTKLKKRLVGQKKFKNHTENLKRVLFKCKSCGSLAKTKHLLLKHLETHIGTPITCVRCRRSFNSKNAYTVHLNLKMCKKSDAAMYNCDQCPKVKL